MFNMTRSCLVEPDKHFKSMGSPLTHLDFVLLIMLVTPGSFMTSPPFGTHERESFFREMESAHAAIAENDEPY